jgi:hypothetical protein
MTWVMKLRLAVAAIAIVVWGYAYKVDDERLRLAGIVLLAIALFLRFADRKRREDDAPAP